MKKNVNWPYMAGLFDSRGLLQTVISSSDATEKVGTTTPVIQHEDEKVARMLLEHLGGVYFDEYDADGMEVFSWHPKGRKNRIRFFTGILPYTIIYRDEIKAILARESVETNTFRPEVPVKIESELHGDMQSAQAVTLDA